MTKAVWGKPKLGAGAALVLVLSVLALGCQPDGGGTGGGAGGGGASTGGGAGGGGGGGGGVVSPGQRLPAVDPDAGDYDLTEYDAVHPGTLTAYGCTSGQAFGGAMSNGVPVQMPGVTIADGGEAFDVTLDGRTYVIHLRPSNLPAFTVTNNDPAPGRIFLAPLRWSALDPGHLLVLDNDGGILFYRYTALPATDFKQVTLPDGGVRYTYLLASGDGYVLDENFHQLRTLDLVPNLGHGALKPDLHEIVMLDDDHFLLEAYIDKVVTNVPSSLPQADGGARVLAAVVQEIQGGQAVFEWDSTDHPELYALSTDKNNFADPTKAADYAHLNSVDVDPNDGDLVLSFRHLDSVLKVHKPDGSIVWRLGGPNDSFNTPPSEKPSHQHYARVIGPNTVRVFDNGNAVGTTRIATYTLDPDAGALTAFEELPLGLFANAMGSWEPVGADSLFIGLGANDPGDPDIVERDVDGGTERFRLKFARDDIFSYRAFKFP
jgi:arylsulfate sulfotransferase